jgi:hypothetical protein
MAMEVEIHYRGNKVKKLTWKNKDVKMDNVSHNNANDIEKMREKDELETCNAIIN